MANVPHITEKQRKFVEILITKGTFQSGKDCATEAGYEESCATVMASKLQNPKYYPLVVAEIEARRNELSRRYSINYKSHLAALGKLRDDAVSAGNFTGAIAAEKYRGMAAGLYIDRKEILHGSIDQMTSKDVEEKLNELRKKLQENGDNAKVIESDPSEGEFVGSDSSDVVSEEGQLSIQDHS